MKDFKNYILFLIDKLLKKPNVDNGFIEVEPTEEDYKHAPEELGGSRVQKKELLPNKDWRPYMPKGELQKRNGNETMACVTFSAMNCLEALVNFHLNCVNLDIASIEQKRLVKIFDDFRLIKDGTANFSDRYPAAMSGTTYRGNSQTKVADAVRHYGLVPEDDCPWVDGWNNYYNLNCGTVGKDKLIDSGKLLLKYIEFNYEWVNPKYFNGTKVFGPIQTSMYAYPNKINDIYQKTSLAKNHAITNHYYVQDQYDGIFDHYDPFEKKVAWDFNLGYGMLYSIHLKNEVYNQEEINRLMARNIKYILKVEGAGEIFELTGDGLKYLTAKEITDLGVSKLSTDKILVGINNADFYRLIN